MNTILKKKQKGVEAIELSIVLSLLMVLAFGVSELGRALYQYNTLAKATRDAARYLSTQGAGVGWNNAKCLAISGTMDCSGPVLAPGLTTAMVSICDQSNCPATHQGQTTGAGSINLVSVTIGGGQGAGTAYQFVSAVPFVIPNINFGPITTTLRQV